MNCSYLGLLLGIEAEMSWLFSICYSRSVFHPICLAPYQRLTFTNSIIQALQLLVGLGRWEVPIEVWRVGEKEDKCLFSVLWWATFWQWLHFSIYSHSFFQVSPSKLQLLLGSFLCSFGIKAFCGYQYFPLLHTLPLLVGSLNPSHTSVNYLFIKLFFTLLECVIFGVTRRGNQSAGI